MFIILNIYTLYNKYINIYLYNKNIHIDWK